MGNGNFVLKEGHSKIWSARNFFRPPNSTPSLRLCMAG